MAYHTSEMGAPHVYHTYKDCPEGKKIEKNTTKTARELGDAYVRYAKRKARHEAQARTSFPSPGCAARRRARPSSDDARTGKPYWTAIARARKPSLGPRTTELHQVLLSKLRHHPGDGQSPVAGSEPLTDPLSTALAGS
jgi:hypothetical protein